MKFIIPALALSACLPAVFSQEQIIPKPAEITLFTGSPARLTPDSLIITETQDKAFLDQAGQLQQMLSAGTGLPLPLKPAGQASKKAACIVIKKTQPWPPGEKKPTPSNHPQVKSSFPQPMPGASFTRGKAWSR